jgi:hypothetical protein
MKRFLPLMLSVFLSVALFSTALAAGPRSAPFALAGKITAIDAVSRTVTVQVVSGNVLVKPYVGKVVTLTTSAATLFRYTDGTTTTATTFETLKVGDPVSAGGTLAAGIWKTSRITIGARFDCLK